MAKQMEQLLEVVEEALRAQGMSAREASILAVGNDGLIKRMRSGRIPTVTRLADLCEVLGLEFYIGLPREGAPVDEERLLLSLQTVGRALEAAGRGNAGLRDTAALVVAVYGLLGTQGEVNAERVRALVEAVT